MLDFRKVLPYKGCRNLCGTDPPILHHFRGLGTEVTSGGGGHARSGQENNHPIDRPGQPAAPGGQPRMRVRGARCGAADRRDDATLGGRVAPSAVLKSRRWVRATTTACTSIFRTCAGGVRVRESRTLDLSAHRWRPPFLCRFSSPSCRGAWMSFCSRQNTKARPSRMKRLGRDCLLRRLHVEAFCDTSHPANCPRAADSSPFPRRGLAGRGGDHDRPLQTIRGPRTVRHFEDEGVQWWRSGLHPPVRCSCQTTLSLRCGPATLRN